MTHCLFLGFRGRFSSYINPVLCSLTEERTQAALQHMYLYTYNKHTDKRIQKMTYGQTNRQTENSCEPSFMLVTITTIPQSTDLSKASYMYEALFADHSGLHFSSGSFLENGVFRGYFGGNKHFFSRRLKKFLCQVASGSLGRRHFLTACSAAHRYGHKARTLD